MKAKTKCIGRRDCVLLGLSTFNGSQYYTLTRDVRVRNGTTHVKLATLDGSRTFWANAQEVLIVEFYGAPQSIERIEAARALNRGC